MSFANANVLIQDFVNEYGFTSRSYRAIDFVRDVSNLNTAINIDSNSFLQAPGKKRQVRVNYFPILCEDEGSCSQNICDTGTKREPAQVMFDITECTATQIYTIAKNDIRQVDYGRWDFSGTALSIIASAMPNMRRLLATKFVTKLYMLAGVHIDGSETKRINTTDSNTGIVNPMGRIEIQREYLDGGFDTPYILGGSEVYNWQQMVNIGGLNQNGQRIDMVDTSNSYYDDGLSAQIMGDLMNGEHILAVDPQMFKFVTYSENAGIFRTGMASLEDLPNLYRNNYGGFLEGVLIDPVTGILFDLYIKYDECEGEWNFMLKLHWDFFTMPEISCNVQGVNGIMHYRTCPQVAITCPAGSPISSPAAATTFEWTPTLAEIPVLAQATIGGKSYVWNTPVAITSLADLRNAMNEVYSPGNPLFVVNGSDIEYDGYSPISGSFNNGDVTFEFE